MTVAMRNNDKSLAPTAIFREKDTAYGLRYCPENQLSKDLSEAFDRNHITGEGIVTLRRCGIRVEVKQ